MGRFADLQKSKVEVYLLSVGAGWFIGMILFQPLFLIQYYGMIVIGSYSAKG